jgi:hypothetical protein
MDGKYKHEVLLAFMNISDYHVIQIKATLYSIQPSACARRH